MTDNKQKKNYYLTERRWLKVYQRYSKPEKRWKAMVVYTDNFFKYVGLPFEDIVFGAFAASNLEKFEEKKQNFVNVFALKADRMELNMERWEWSNIPLYNGHLHGYHFWDTTEAFDAWMMDHLQCKYKECRKADDDDCEKKYFEDNQHHLWIKEKLLPPAGQKEWTVDELRKLDHRSKRQNKSTTKRGK